MKELPIACKLSGDEFAERTARWRTLAEHGLITAEKTDRGAVQRYRWDEPVERELRELIALEAECCSFLDLRVERQADELVLEVTGPPGSEEIVAAFAGR
jgi:hypothetical protein